MAVQTGLYLDTGEFMEGFEKYVKKHPEITAEALFKKVGPRVIADAIEVEPRAPHLWGELWKSQRILEPVIKKNEIFFFVGFNIIYATYLHEGLETWHWTLPGSGPKYLEAKLERFADEYLKLVAEHVDEAVGSMK